MTLTRRDHPLEGQRFEVMRGGPTHIVVRLPDGTMRVPRSWTDADGASTSHGPDTIFSIETLKEMIELLEALRRRGLKQDVPRDGAVPLADLCVVADAGSPLQEESHAETDNARPARRRARDAVEATAGALATRSRRRVVAADRRRRTSNEQE